ncbi:hypothetical protein [Streptomyces sp. NPDC002088]|uniref:hypothetical protein n=1 Tax=Streptomyces sp. NPDC002088 TaxID=3154665 RepID=UPI00332CF901
MQDAEPTDDDLMPEPVLPEAVAAAILNHPDFVVATPDFPREDTITVQTRSEIRHLLLLDVDRDADGGQALSTPADTRYCVAAQLDECAVVSSATSATCRTASGPSKSNGKFRCRYR